MKLITHTTALQLKSFGFNESTEYAYSAKDENSPAIKYEFPMNWNETSNNICAPSQSDLQEWFRDVKNIDVYVMPVFRDKVGYDSFKRDGYTFEVVRIEPSTFFVWSDFNVCAEDRDNEDKEFDCDEIDTKCLKPSVSTYEEALELGLQYVLTTYSNE